MCGFGVAQPDAAAHVRCRVLVSQGRGALCAHGLACPSARVARAGGVLAARVAEQVVAGLLAEGPAGQAATVQKTSDTQGTFGAACPTCCAGIDHAVCDCTGQTRR